MAEEQRRTKLEDQAKAAERFLVLRNFEEADRISRYVLQQAQYVPDSSTEQQRAAFVFLQALFELERCTCVTWTCCLAVFCMLPDC